MYVHTYSCKVPLSHLIFQYNLKFRVRFSKSIQISNLINILPVDAKLFQEDGRTDGRTDRQKKRREERQTQQS